MPEDNYFEYRILIKTGLKNNFFDYRTPIMTSAEGNNPEKLNIYRPDQRITILNTDPQESKTTIKLIEGDGLV